MKDGLRSMLALALSLAATVAATILLAMLIFPDRGPATAGPGGTPRATIGIGAIPPSTGGSLAVSGDRAGTFGLDRDSYKVSINPDFERGFARVEFGRFGLLGETGAVYFTPEPLAVEQIDFDGLAFYPESDQCMITPGELNPEIGVASARLVCADLTDVRETGTVTFDGGVALPADMLGMRGDLPASGGQVDVGDQTLKFSDGRILVQNVMTEDTERQPLFLYGDDEVSSIGFERDPETGQLFLTYLVVNEELFEIADEACRVTTEELGPLNPITTVLDVSVQCEALDLGRHGAVAIDTTLVIDLILESEFVSASG